MTNEQASEILDDYDVNFEGHTAEEVAQAFDCAFKALDQTRWIPVSDRLPEKNVWVLVTVVQGSSLYVETMRIDKYKGMFTDNIDYYGSVIAWMPLPQPYTAESEEV